MSINYKQLAGHTPTVYSEFVNSIGQKIKLVEHPIKEDGAQVIAMCDELQLADYTSFYDTDDMLADHKEYEPKFIDGRLWIGDFLNN